MSDVDHRSIGGLSKQLTSVELSACIGAVHLCQGVELHSPGDGLISEGIRSASLSKWRGRLSAVQLIFLY